MAQRYVCTRCGKYSSDSQTLDGVRLEEAKVVQIVKLLAEGLGIRSTARVCDCRPETVLNVLQTIGPKCGALHDRLVRNVKTDALQIDELWARVFCSQKTAGPGEPEKGDQYTFLALAAREKAIVSFHTGKRDNDNTDVFVQDVARRVEGRIQITTDAFSPYPATIRRYLLERLDYAVMVKQFAETPGQVEAKRRYSPAPFVGVRVKVKAGAPRRDRICTSRVERANLSVRHFNKRFTRLSLRIFQDPRKPPSRAGPVRLRLQFLQGSFDYGLYASICPWIGHRNVDYRKTYYGDQQRCKLTVHYRHSPQARFFLAAPPGCGKLRATFATVQGFQSGARLLPSRLPGGGAARQ